jgi:polar amino acid transport system substrate-binding protein
MRFGAPALLFLLAIQPGMARSATPPLTIMVEDASEPFSRHDGTGYANDIVRAAFQASGIEVRLDVVPYARCKKSLEDGATPACFAMSWLPEFKNRIVFSALPLFEVHADVYSRRSARISGTQDLKPGSMLGIINGYEYPDAIPALARQGVVLEGNVSEAANLQMLAKGRLDAAVAMTSEIENMPRRLSWIGVEHAVRFAFRSGSMKSYIGFSPANPRGEEARRAFNRGYAIIVANHARDKIHDAWMKKSFQVMPGP